MDGNYVHNISNINNMNGPEPHQTAKDPTKLKYTVDSLFNNDYMYNIPHQRQGS